MRASLKRQKQTFDLAMLASDMGTWRYTLADNVCVYDENAQRLYGLTEARFPHDAAGVQTKFHADDLDLMWARAAKALDPAGDGRYDVEYRVKQLDGQWKWLSAWGLVDSPLTMWRPTALFSKKSSRSLLLRYTSCSIAL